MGRGTTSDVSTDASPVRRRGAAALVHAVCPHDCPDRCSLLCHVRGGRLVRVEGNPAHPVTRGFLCRKMAAAAERVYAPERVLRPLVRVGPKGAARFRAASWAEAVGTIAERWREICARRGPAAVLPFFGSGTEGLVQGHAAGRRFFNRLGTLQLERTICTAAGRAGYHYTMGASHVADPTAAEGVALLVLWGANPAATNVHHAALARAARRRGARLAVVNPVRVAGAAGAEHFLQPRPGSDAALALGLMHVLVEEGLCDAAFIRRYTYGFDALRARVRAYPPARVAGLTDVPAAKIVALARDYARRRPALVYVGPGGLRHTNAGMTLRTIACLPALVGDWLHPGGGVYFPTSTVFPVAFDALEGAGLRPTPPAGYNMLDLGRLLTEDGRPVESLYVFNGNPAAVLYDQRRVRSGLERPDLFTVVHERYLTDTARYADVVLPATTPFEHDDLLVSYYQPSLLLSRRAIAPVGESRSNLETFAALAAALGFDDACFRQTAADVVAEALATDHPALRGVTLPRLAATGWMPLDVPPPHVRFRRAPLATPSGRIELCAPRMATLGLDPLPTYVPPRESREASPALFARHPLHLLTPSGHAFLNSNYAHERGWLRTERRPSLVLHPADAAPRGLRDGDLARVRNDRGQCLLWAVVSDAVRPGVVVAPGQWWSRHYPDGGNANMTTPDFRADMAGGSAFNSNLVEVERAAGRSDGG
jgi:anaerobic selenocysteine-containing dehydrogenase